MTYCQEQTKTEIVVLSKDELKEVIREVFAELNIEQRPARDGWMLRRQQNTWGKQIVLKEGKIKSYQHVPGGIVRYSKKQCDYYIEQFGK